MTSLPMWIEVVFMEFVMRKFPYKSTHIFAYISLCKTPNSLNYSSHPSVTFATFLYYPDNGIHVFYSL